MESTNKTYFGYHGTIDKNVERILKEGFKKVVYNFSISPQKQSFPGDLGAGNYFFYELHNHEKAYNNAKSFIKKINNDQQNSIIKATIEVDVKKILDMDDDDNIIFFEELRNSNSYSEMETIFNFSKTNKNRKNLDGIFIERLIKDNSMDVDLVVKKTFTPNKMSRNMISNFPNGTEICVRKPFVIKKTEKLMMRWNE